MGLAATDPTRTTGRRSDSFIVLVWFGLVWFGVGFNGSSCGEDGSVRGEVVGWGEQSRRKRRLFISPSGQDAPSRLVLRRPARNRTAA